MWKYILKKLLLAVPVLLGITILDYALMSLAGSPLDMMVGPRITEGTIAARAAQWGLDQPFYVQYWNWLTEVLHGNLGYAYKSGQTVSEIIGSHLGPTLLLMGVSMVLGLLIAVPGGIYSAVHRYQKRDYAVVSASFVLSSVPGFFLALLLAAITSAISLMEVVVAFIIEEMHRSRKKAVLLCFAVCGVVGVFCSLSFGPLSDFKLFSLSVFDFFDYITSNIMLPVGGMLLAVFAGWRLKRANYLDELTNGGKLRIPRWLALTIYYLVKLVAPVGISLIFLNCLFS